MAVGQGWEAQLRSWHRVYRANGLAHVVKTEAPVKVIRQMGKGRFVAVYSRKGPVDFIGAARGLGTVAFDAKHTDKSTFAVSVVPEHQRRDLDRWADQGAVTFIALRCSHGCYVLPWERVRHMSGALDPREVGRAMDEDGWLSCLF